MQSVPSSANKINGIWQNGELIGQTQANRKTENTVLASIQAKTEWSLVETIVDTEETQFEAVRSINAEWFPMIAEHL